MFQSLSGFFRPCNPINNKWQFIEVNSFNPCRVFSGLATPYFSLVATPCNCFNPCRVFSGLATFHPAHVSFLILVVSIPVGFFQALQHNKKFWYPWPPAKVSIPVGFFQALQRRLTTIFRTEYRVSIPVGFFQALQPRSDLIVWGVETMFQSLSGFFRPCNLQLTTYPKTPEMFQSLSGFFRPCNARAVWLGGRGTGVFQSLSGFFRPCNGTPGLVISRYKTF